MVIRGLIAVILGALAAGAACAEPDLAAAFGAREQIESVRISPDGRRLAYIVPTKGQGAMVLTYAPGIDKEPRAVLTANGDPDRISDCDWVANDRLVCTQWGMAQLIRAGFVTYTRIVAVDADGGNPRTLSRTGGFDGGSVIDLLPAEDGKLLMRRPGSTYVEKVDSRTARVSHPLEDGRDNLTHYLSDGHGTIRIMVIEKIEANRNAGVRRAYYRLVGSDKWQILGDYDYVDDIGFYPVAVDHDQNAVYGFRKKDGRQAVYRIVLDGSMREELVFARDDVDISGIVTIGRRHRVIGATYVTDTRRTEYFDPALARLADSLAKALPKQMRVRIVDSSLDEKKLLILASGDDDPGVYYILDRTTREMAIFQPVRPQLEGRTLAKMRAVTYPAADGTKIPAYLTLPPGGAGRNLPAIIMPHGGPSARDEWGFNWLVQYYAARGYAVLQPNFRGSAGYGDDWFKENAFKAWNTAIGDIIAGGHWLIGQGIADPAKLGGVGWSYGGYAVLQSAVVDPTLFKGVVAVAPVTDLGRLKDQYKWWSNRKLMSQYIGSGLHLEQASPARNAARIKVPVLLFHGTKDRNVDIDHSTLMAARLTEAGVPHRLVTFDKLDHQLEDSEARARLLRESDAFLRQAMGM